MVLARMDFEPRRPGLLRGASRLDLPRHRRRADPPGRQVRHLHRLALLQRVPAGRDARDHRAQPSGRLHRQQLAGPAAHQHLLLRPLQDAVPGLCRQGAAAGARLGRRRLPRLGALELPAPHRPLEVQQPGHPRGRRRALRLAGDDRRRAALQLEPLHRPPGHPARGRDRHARPPAAQPLRRLRAEHRGRQAAARGRGLGQADPRVDAAVPARRARPSASPACRSPRCGSGRPPASPAASSPGGTTSARCTRTGGSTRPPSRSSPGTRRTRTCWSTASSAPTSACLDPAEPRLLRPRRRRRQDDGALSRRGEGAEPRRHHLRAAARRRDRRGLRAD